MPENELPGDGDWAAVRTAIRGQMEILGMSAADLSQETGIPETTIRDIGQPGKRLRSTLAALSGALGWRHDYLADVLCGAADPGTPPQLMIDIGTAMKLLHAEIAPLREEMDRTNEKLDTLRDVLDTILDRERKPLPLRMPAGPAGGRNTEHGSRADPFGIKDFSGVPRPGSHRS